MSARPHIPRLEGEELDLLISRSLDGDLSPEETRDLETILANDPAARKRQEELAGVVAEARALPAPAPPFALSTRVNANVSEKSARGGSIFHRFGFYPPPGFAIGAMVVLGFVAIGITLLNPAPKRTATLVAGKSDGPVEVFFQDKARANDSLKDAAARPAPVAAEASGDSFAARIPSKKKMPEAREEGSVAVLESKQAASVVASNEPVLDEKQNKLSKSEVARSEGDMDASRSRRIVVEAPVLSAAAPQAAGAVAPAAPAETSAMAPAAPAPAAPAPAANAARALQSAPTRTWNVAIRGDGARRWMLRRAPEVRPTAATAAPASFRITLDSEGRVTALRPLDPRAVQPALLAFVRGLVFAPVGDAASSVGVATTFGYTSRDREQKAKDERADAAGAKADAVAVNPSEIEVEVSAH